MAGCGATVTGAETAATACAPSDLPQCIQKAALAFTVPPQCGQLVVAASACTSCTGVPHSGQNFFPVTSLPHFVQGVMDFPFSIKLVVLLVVKVMILNYNEYNTDFLSSRERL